MTNGTYQRAVKGSLPFVSLGNQLVWPFLHSFKMHCSPSMTHNGDVWWYLPHQRPNFFLFQHGLFRGCIMSHISHWSKLLFPSENFVCYITSEVPNTHNQVGTIGFLWCYFFRCSQSFVWNVKLIITIKVDIWPRKWNYLSEKHADLWHTATSLQKWTWLILHTFNNNEFLLINRLMYLSYVNIIIHGNFVSSMDFLFLLATFSEWLTTCILYWANR